MDWDEVSVHKNEKQRTRLISSYLHQTSLVNRESISQYSKKREWQVFFLGLKKKAYYDDMYLFFIWQIGKLSNLVGLLYILKESPQKQTHFLLRNDINFSYLVFHETKLPLCFHVIFSTFFSGFCSTIISQKSFLFYHLTVFCCLRMLHVHVFQSNQYKVSQYCESETVSATL